MAKKKADHFFGGYYCPFEGDPFLGDCRLSGFIKVYEGQPCSNVWLVLLTLVLIRYSFYPLPVNGT